MFTLLAHYRTTALPAPKRRCTLALVWCAVCAGGCGGRRVEASGTVAADEELAAGGAASGEVFERG